MKKRTKLNLLIILTIFLIGYFAFKLFDIEKTSAQKTNEMNEILSNNAKIEEENKQYSKELDSSNDDEFTKKIAKEKLGLVEQNERVFVDISN